MHTGQALGPGRVVSQTCDFTFLSLHFHVCKMGTIPRETLILEERRG